MQDDVITSEELFNQIKDNSINIRVQKVVYDIIKNSSIQNNMELSDYMRYLINKELYPYILQAAITKKIPIGDKNEKFVEDLIIKEFVADTREEAIDELIVKLRDYKSKIIKLKKDRKKIVEKYSKMFNREFISF